VHYSSWRTYSVSYSMYCTVTVLHGHSHRAPVHRSREFEYVSLTQPTTG